MTTWEGMTMRRIATLALMSGALLAAACNTARGAVQDVKSVGTVFTGDNSNSSNSAGK
jgi:predicted small secreted protein